MTASLHEVTALQVGVFQPLWKGSSKLTDIVERLAGYSHEILADGGFERAEISFMAGRAEVEDWFENGLGRHVEVYNRKLDIVFEGFCDVVTVARGALTSETRGPLMDVGNRVSAVYTPLDTSVYPPVTGTTTVTTIAEDTASQAKYGIIEKVINAGTCTKDDAEAARDLFLAENAEPLATGDISLPPGDELQVTITVLGYHHWLGVYVYNDATVGFTTISAKLVLVLAADPNGIFSTDTSQIATNAYLTPYQEIQNQFAIAIVQSMLALGDISNNRYTFGFYKDRRAYYQQAPTALAYDLQLAAPEQMVIDRASNAPVEPWDVRPAKWVFVSDWLLGRGEPAADFRDDPRCKFVESLSYTAPWDLQLQGGKLDRTPQLLAKLGVGGR